VVVAVVGYLSAQMEPGLRHINYMH
jgi:hypothetical protein